MSVAVLDRNLTERQDLWLSCLECSYPSPSNLQHIAPTRLAFIGVGADMT